MAAAGAAAGGAGGEGGAGGGGGRSGCGEGGGEEGDDETGEDAGGDDRRRAAARRRPLVALHSAPPGPADRRSPVVNCRVPIVADVTLRCQPVTRLGRRVGAACREK